MAQVADTHRKSTVDFFFSPGSRYSYLAASQIPALEVETNCTVEWRPVNGTDIRALRGRDPFVGEPVSGQYDWAYRQRDAERWAAHYGIRFREPPVHRFDFGVLVRAATAAKQLGFVAEYGWRLCCAVYGSDLWPNDRSVCVRIAGELGLDTAKFSDLLDHSETERISGETAQEAFRRGAFGVPTFFLGDEMFWGNDRLVLLKHALANRRR